MNDRSVRALLSRTKALTQRVLNSRHRAFHAQRKITDPGTRAKLADKLARRLPRTAGDEPDEVGALQQDGYLLLDTLLSAAQIGDIRAHFADKLAFDLTRRRLGKFIAPGSVPLETHGAEYGHADVLAAPHLLRTANNPYILRLAEAYLGATPVIAALRVWWTLPTPGAEPQETELFHRDFDDFRFVKLFVYLTDVDAGSGPHVFVRGSHRTALLSEIRRYSEAEVTAAVGQETLVRFLGARGTAFMEATYGLHRATPPVTRPRLAFQALYTVRATIYGPSAPLRSRTTKERDLSPYTNQLYLRA